MTVDLAESEWVRRSDGAASHHDDVTHDASDSGRGAFVGHHLRGVVVRLVSHDESVFFTFVVFCEFNDSGIFTHTQHDLRAFGGQGFEEVTRGFIRAMFTALNSPNDGFGEGGSTTEQGFNLAGLVGCEADFDFAKHAQSFLIR